MIVKFLAKSSSFKGVRYNTNKVEKDKGELMKVSGFGPLQGLSQLMPQDYINYLKMVSARNTRVAYPQLHVVISAKGNASSAEELTGIAVKWLDLMGYGEQPYLIVFHKDTSNHHVHVVSSRVDKFSGMKISSSYEKVRAQAAINQIMGLDERQMAKADLQKAMSFNFQTKAQFMMILESMGYQLSEEKGFLYLNKFGRKLVDVELAFLGGRKSGYRINQARASQITALLHKYKSVYSSELRPVSRLLPGGAARVARGYTSELAEEFRRMFGIELIFHGAAGKLPYGYTVLDLDKGNVFKGSEILALQELLDDGHSLAGAMYSRNDTELNDGIIRFDDLGENVYGAGAAHELNHSADQPLISSSTHLTKNSTIQELSADTDFAAFEQAITIAISDDIDDEAIHGRNRHRKRQARTNSR